MQQHKKKCSTYVAFKLPMRCWQNCSHFFNVNMLFVTEIKRVIEVWYSWIFCFVLFFCYYFAMYKPFFQKKNSIKRLFRKYILVRFVYMQILAYYIKNSTKKVIYMWQLYKSYTIFSFRFCLFHLIQFFVAWMNIKYKKLIFNFFYMKQKKKHDSIFVYKYCGYYSTV